MIREYYRRKSSQHQSIKLQPFGLDPDSLLLTDRESVSDQQPCPCCHSLLPPALSRPTPPSRQVLAIKLSAAAGNGGRGPLPDVALADD